MELARGMKDQQNIEESRKNAPALQPLVENGVLLTATTAAIIMGTLNSALDNDSSGSMRYWQNPSTKASGTVTVYDDLSNSCRGVQITLDSKSMRSTACKESNGWQLR